MSTRPHRSVRTLEQLIISTGDFELVVAAFHLDEVRDPAQLVRAAGGVLEAHRPDSLSLRRLRKLRVGSYGEAWRIFPAALSELGYGSPASETQAYAVISAIVARMVLSGRIDPVDGTRALVDLWLRRGEPPELEPFFIALNTVDGDSSLDDAMRREAAMKAFMETEGT